MRSFSGAHVTRLVGLPVNILFYLPALFGVRDRQATSRKRMVACKGTVFRVRLPPTECLFSEHGTIFKPPDKANSLANSSWPHDNIRSDTNKTLSAPACSPCDLLTKQPQHSTSRFMSRPHRALTMLGPSASSPVARGAMTTRPISVGWSPCRRQEVGGTLRLFGRK